MGGGLARMPLCMVAALFQEISASMRSPARALLAYVGLVGRGQTGPVRPESDLKTDAMML